jgi:hypothetical protein
MDFSGSVTSLPHLGHLAILTSQDGIIRYRKRTPIN